MMAPNYHVNLSDGVIFHISVGFPPLSMCTFRLFHDTVITH